MTNKEKINELTKRLTEISRKQESFAKEINAIRRELYDLKAAEYKAETSKKEVLPIVEKVEKPLLKEKVEAIVKDDKYIDTSASEPLETLIQSKTSYQTSNELEKFIGENLISKIGIIITIIGVAIGAKYSIDNDLISPITRIILGYVMGLGLLGVGIRLKSKYENYSAVLVSGAIAIMYFITFIAFNYYGLIPKMVAFAMMVIFTIFTVLAAINYNRQIIALIGLVGAYAVPFFLSDGSGDVRALFAYVAIINVGILVIAFQRYWKLLYYSSFILTWIIFFAWFQGDYYQDDTLAPTLLYGTIFFAIFYVAFLAYKLIQKEQFDTLDVLLLLANSFVYYYLCFVKLSDVADEYLGIFTIANSMIHLLVSVIIYKQKAADKALFYFVSGLMLVFLTISIPVELEGKWITLFWIGMAVVLFWIGRTRNIAFYERFSYIHIFLSFFSLIAYWFTTYGSFYYSDPLEDWIKPILNIHFFTTLLYVLGIGYINWLHRRAIYTKPLENKLLLSDFISFSMTAIFLVSLYFLFRLEISNAFEQWCATALNQEEQKVGYQYNYLNSNILNFKEIWLLNYSLFFIGLLAFFNIKKLKSKAIGYVNLVLNFIGVALVLTFGLTTFAELQGFYLMKEASENITITWKNIAIRYTTYIFLMSLIYATYKYIATSFMDLKERRALDIIVHLVVVVILSFELVSWLELMNNANSDKLGLSILWSVYALGLIVLGIWKRKEHLRFGAIALFAVTLLKLFFYDIAHLDTISKTIVFVVIGLLLLLVSFLYNKYKDLII